LALGRLRSRRGAPLDAFLHFSSVTLTQGIYQREAASPLSRTSRPHVELFLRYAVGLPPSSTRSLSTGPTSSTTTSVNKISLALHANDTTALGASPRSPQWHHLAVKLLRRQTKSTSRSYSRRLWAPTRMPSSSWTRRGCRWRMT